MADTASIGLFSRVGPLVYDEVSFLCEALVADSAGVRAFTSVGAMMVNKTCIGSQLFTTGMTLNCSIITVQ